MMGIRHSIHTVGCSTYEGMKGKYVRVATKGWGSTVKIIGNILEDKWFDYGSFFDDMKNDTADNKGTEVIWRRNT